MKRSGVYAQGSLIFLVAMLIISGTGLCVSGAPGNMGLFGLSLLSWVWLAGRASISAGEMPPEGIARRLPFFAGSAVILILMAVYYFNPTHRWAENAGALPVHHIRFLPGSAFSEGTQASLLFVVTALAATGLAMTLGRRKASLLLTIISIGGALTALAALGQRLTPRVFPVFETTGFFIYENHFAAFANLILPVTLTCGTRAQSRAFLAGKASSPAGLYYWTAFLLVVAVVFSRSRAGVLIAGLILFAFFLMKIRLRHRHPFTLPPAFLPVRVGWGLTAATAVTAMIAVVFYSWQRGSQIMEQLAFRGQVLADAFSIFREHPGWGTGPGSFAAIFPYYQTVPVETHFFSHAHCEPVEFLVEYGLIGGGILLTAFVSILFFGPAHRIGTQQTPSFRELEGFGLWIALAGVSLHSLIDFPLRHPLNALLIFVWIGILAGYHFSGQKLAERKIMDE